MSTHEPPANFDPLARSYRWMEYLTLGPALQRCRTYYLSSLPDRRYAIVLGDGDGRFLACLLAANPTLHADAVDSSAAMLRQLTRRTSPMRDRLSVHHANALDFAPTHTYDLIVTHFFLDCLSKDEVNDLSQHLAQHVSPKALWLVSEFRIPAGAMRRPARGFVRLLYLAFRLLTGLRTTKLPDHASAFGAAGFHLLAEHHSLAGLLTSELWEYTPTMNLPPQRPKTPHPPDPVPDPEPSSPSLPEPDPGVFHHDPGAQKPNPQVSSDQ